MSFRPLDILVLYNADAVKTQFVYQHAASFAQHSRHRIHYAPATSATKLGFSLDLFDAIIIHFAVRLPFDGVLSKSIGNALATFTGIKVALIQDEYDLPARTTTRLKRLGVDIVFTTTPEDDRETFYPTTELPDVVFKRCLTGYVPDTLPDTSTLTPIADRSTLICYRGRRLPVWYGSLAAEKHRIAVDMKRICNDRGVPHDIESSEESRIYGEDWFAFLKSARATLGTESGANVVDVDGSIRNRVSSAMAADPKLSEPEAYERYVAPFDNLVHMNQISPKIFEAIALKTGLILYEGTYSGILEAGRHYLSLKKDYSNIDDILAQVEDVSFMQNMVDAAYDDIAGSGLYSYRSFVDAVDRAIEAKAEPVREAAVATWRHGAVYALDQDGKTVWRVTGRRTPPLELPFELEPPLTGSPVPHKPFTQGKTRRIWLSLPYAVRYPVIKMVEFGRACMRVARR